MTPGNTYLDTTGATWVYVGYRKTTVGSREKHFVKLGVIKGTFGPRTYKATYAETIKRKFPAWEGQDGWKR